VQLTVSREDAGPAQRHRLAAAGGDPPAGLLDEEPAGPESAGGQLELQVDAGHPEPDHAEVERRRAEPADAVDVPPLQVADRGKGRVQPRIVVVVVPTPTELCIPGTRRLNHHRFTSHINVDGLNSARPDVDDSVTQQEERS